MTPRRSPPSKVRAAAVGLTGMALLLSAPAPAPAQPDQPPGPPTTMPMREIAGVALDNIVNDPETTVKPLGALNVSTAAMANAKSISVSAGTGDAVERGTNATASVYASDVIPTYDNIGHPAPPLPTSAEKFDFKQTGDASQTWATMSRSGRPFAAVNVFGKASGSAVASWRTTFTVEGQSGKKEVFLSFYLPSVEVTGFNETDGPSLWRSRFRVDLMVNGFPGWYVDVVRFNELGRPFEGGKRAEAERHLAVFGSKTMGHVDVPEGVPQDGSTAKSVVVFLGAFPAGSSIDVSMVFRAEARSETQCGVGDDGELFCTRATVSMNWREGLFILDPMFLLRPALSHSPPSSSPSSAPPAAPAAARPM